ncbi:LysR family transcriptional regulator [Saccharospirillum salsuginis]|uniref:LysR family transcriptional regulator n=1 Tax=Saccharospirillum salsuginis TaxID=418750 RepID=A0A918K339_9GAMM|nr:LysR family transcriptional regulator [Saccharospirillum salsuginis]GGX43161.1 LysR family transcriptional regulator [Saccharospirillum salsuginis]
MNETNIDWNDLHLFLAVAREGGLSKAAKTTQLSAATLGRRMHSLERSMGRELFVRHDRGYELTAEGKTLLEGLAEIESDLFRLTAQPTQGDRPLVKISAGTWTTLALLPHLDTLTGTPPDLRLRFISAEQVLDISHREVVIGFRNRRPTEETLVCRKLARVEFAPYATESAPERWVKVLADTPSSHWLDRTVGNDAVCEVNTPRNSLDLALAGQGIALLPTFIGDLHPQLHRTGGPIGELSHDQWLVTHQDDRHLPEVRRAIERLCQVLEGAGH